MAVIASRDSRFDGVEIFGLFLLSFGRACVNLHALAGAELDHLLAGVEPLRWQHAARFMEALSAIEKRFQNFEPILERIGSEMMNLWYESGPGRSIVKKAIDFLYFQTGSSGYASVARGPAERLGSFTLVSIDPEQGSAVVHSTTPFARSMERGVLIGGLQLASDLVYVDVDNSTDQDVFHISFH